MEFMYTEIMACLTGAEQNQIVKHFIHLNNVFGVTLKLITFLGQNGLKPNVFICLEL